MDKNIKIQPLVSVAICTYNRADFIMNSIQSALNQNYENIEIIIVDDASTDDTEQIIKQIKSPKFPIHYFKNLTNLKIAKSRNETIKHSSGKYIAILDSDDYWIDSNKISKQVQFLETHPDHALVGTYATLVDQHNHIIGEMKNEIISTDIKKQMLVTNQFMHSSILYRTEVLNEYGLFKAGYGWEDYDLLLKIGRKYEFANIPEKMVAYRKHTGSISNQMSFSKKISFLLILLKNFPFYPQRFRSIFRRLKL